MLALALLASAVFARLCAVGAALGAEARPAPLAVEVTNASEAESCAEKDNVTVTFASPRLRRFRIEAAHPAYIGGVAGDGDSREPDWTDCDIAHGDETPPPTERRVTFYESPFLWVTGYEFSDYWRRRDVPVRIGDRVEHNLTMVQLWVFVRGKAEQVVVFYPTDGIWRIHPLPPRPSCLERLWLLLLRRACRDAGAAGRRDQGGRLRSGDQELPPQPSRMAAMAR